MEKISVLRKRVFSLEDEEENLLFKFLSRGQEELSDEEASEFGRVSYKKILAQGLLEEAEFHYRQFERGEFH
jgi:hypothetical protein